MKCLKNVIIANKIISVTNGKCTNCWWGICAVLAPHVYWMVLVITTVMPVNQAMRDATVRGVHWVTMVTPHNPVGSVRSVCAARAAHCTTFATHKRGGASANLGSGVIYVTSVKTDMSSLMISVCVSIPYTVL